MDEIELIEDKKINENTLNNTFPIVGSLNIKWKIIPIKLTLKIIQSYH